MQELEPKFRCTSCHRGVLSRSAARCLFCGTELPAEARLSEAEMAKRDAEYEELEAESRKLREQQAAARAEAARAHVYIDYSNLF